MDAMLLGIIYLVLMIINIAVSAVIIIATLLIFSVIISAIACKVYNIKKNKGEENRKNNETEI